MVYKDEGEIRIEASAKKLPIATFTIALINISIFALAFIKPNLALGLSITSFVVFIIIVCLREILIAKLVAWHYKVKEATESIEDAAEREKQHTENAISIIALLFITGLFLLAIYQTWRKRLFGLLLSSLLSICVIVCSRFYALGQNMITFLYIISFYLFIRILVGFILNPLGEIKTLSKIPKVLKVCLELDRIFFLGMAVIGRDGTFVSVPPSVFEGVVATIAVDSILATISPKKDVPDKCKEN